MQSAAVAANRFEQRAGPGRWARDANDNCPLMANTNLNDGDGFEASA
jgi:hypothetical protein